MNVISFALSSQQQAIRDVAREFAHSQMRSAAQQLERHWEFPGTLLATAAELGLTTYALPERIGGGGLDPVSCAIVMEELAWGDAGLATLLTSAQLFAGGLLAAGATRDQQDRWLRPMCVAEGAIGAIAFSEPHAGSDVANIATRAVRDGSGWRISGEKTWITGAMHEAAAMLVFARTGDPGAGGISCFVVEGAAPGITCSKLDVHGLRTSWTGNIFLDEVRVEADQLIGAEGGGFAAAMGFFAHSRPQVAAAAIGVARAAFEHAVEYAREREAFGSPLINNQGIAFNLADMGMEIEAARALVWQSCDSIDRGLDPGLIGSYAKAFAADVAMRVTTEAVQVLGAAGLTPDHPTARWMRDAKVLQIVEGASQIQRLIASRYLRQGVVACPR